MKNEWHELTTLTGGRPITVERVRIDEGDICIQGRFELPPLAQLPAEDQVFVMAFIRAHGSIREMERVFGISYPTVKNRLNRVSALFEFVEVEALPDRTAVLAQLESGDITPEEAIGRLST